MFLLVKPCKHSLQSQGMFNSTICCLILFLFFLGFLIAFLFPSYYLPSFSHFLGQTFHHVRYFTIHYIEPKLIPLLFPFMGPCLTPPWLSPSFSARQSCRCWLLWIFQLYVMCSPTVMVSVSPYGWLVKLWRKEKAILVLGYLPFTGVLSCSFWWLRSRDGTGWGLSVWSVESGTWDRLEVAHSQDKD